MNQVHITLQGKGGVGKSFVSSLLVQYLRSRGKTVRAVDTDPVNATLADYSALEAERVELMDGSTINERKFDELIEGILASTDTAWVVDNGASSFIPLMNYLVENSAIQVMADAGVQVTVHTVVTGGQALEDTLRGLKSLVTQLPAQAQVIVWLNEFFGDIEAVDSTGVVRPFEQMKVYAANQDRISGLIRIHRQTSSTFGKDIQLMLDAKQTFDQVANSTHFGLMARQRLATVRRALWEQMDAVVA
ncbi:MAG: conjugal transfer protein TraL [Burkholderiales bacterium]|nr:conjugal transfer protein TraL [Burkholderiales bacterium]